MNNQKFPSTREPKNRRQWETMHLIYLGDVRNIVQNGGGKLSAVGGDTGDSRKQKPTG